MQNLIERINILINKIRQLVAVKNLSTPQGQKIFQVAKMHIGKDASPLDRAPDNLGCADTVCTLLNVAGFNTPWFISTINLFSYLNSQNTYVKVDTPLAGDIVISPTGQGNGSIAHGHVGIVGEGGVIMSNSSATGTFEPNFTITSWNNRYKIRGGFPVVYFRRMI